MLWETGKGRGGVAILRVEGSPEKVTFKQKWEGWKRREGRRREGDEKILASSE